MLYEQAQANYTNYGYPQYNPYYDQASAYNTQVQTTQQKSFSYPAYQDQYNQNFQMQQYSMNNISADQSVIYAQDSFYKGMNTQQRNPRNSNQNGTTMRNQKRTFVSGHQSHQGKNTKATKGFTQIDLLQECPKSNFLQVPNKFNRKSTRKDSFDYNSDASTTIGDNEHDCSQGEIMNGRIPRIRSPDEYFEEATCKKPKKQFTTEEERNDFVKQYQMKFKTEMCRNWELFGKCKFQDKCSFAHGDHELHKKTHLPSNYKTKTCTQFHTTAYCPYGNRCQFLHSQFDIYNKKRIDYSLILNENARLSEERANSLKGGSELLSYVNVFPTRRLNVFKNIAQKV